MLRTTAPPSSSACSARRLTFLYQDGLVLAATLRGMDAVGFLGSEAPTALSRSAYAHLRVGFHTLAQAGWLASVPQSPPQSTALDWSAAGRSVLLHRHAYTRLGNYLRCFTNTSAESWSWPWNQPVREEFAALTVLASARWHLDDIPLDVREQVLAHLDGALAIPALLWMDANNRLQQRGPALPDGEFGAAIARLLRVLGWLSLEGTWTPHGFDSLPFVPHLGLAGSYLPLFAHLPDLYSGVPSGAVNAPAHGEWHVQRTLNVRASTAAHRRYFADSDAIIAAVLDREPLALQPRFVLDVGCGDGTWLARIAEAVVPETRRGRQLDEHPLLLVGVDPSPVARDRARQTLAAVSAHALVLPGDVGDPDGLAIALANHGLAMTDGLHLHAFVDHDRAVRTADFAGPESETATGSPYLDDFGDGIGQADVEADLTAHLARWAPHIGRHGMVMLEGHSVPATVSSRHVGAHHAIAFEAYHRYSQQYPVERHAFVRALRAAGLTRAATGARQYPTTRPFVSVSLDHLLPDNPADPLPRAAPDAPRADSWTPGPAADLDDGRALHALLYESGNVRYPRSWCAAPTNTLITGAVRAIEARVEELGAGGVVRVCDYGTGTGLAAIELLKACRERGIDERLARRGAELEVHLLDIPSSWFAQGHSLLGNCAFTRFHSLTDSAGRFRPLLEVTGGRRMDVIMASMVFHLVPFKALESLAADLARVASPGGFLFWNAPDLGPASPWSVLFHDPNRALRAQWKAMLTGAMPVDTAARKAAVRCVRRDASGQALIDDARADRRILSRPHSGQSVADAMSRWFSGTVSTQLHEMNEGEVLDALRVPSNQREFLPEIVDDDIRWALIEELMKDVILPTLRAGPAGGGSGHSVQWTLGEHRVTHAG
ncbi:MAG: class I SAM-dependent methyltransferase [bacterium]